MSMLADTYEVAEQLGRAANVILGCNEVLKFSSQERWIEAPRSACKARERGEGAPCEKETVVRIIFFFSKSGMQGTNCGKGRP